MSDDLHVRAALDRLAIRELQATYGDVVTRQAWHELDALFLPDCPVRLDVRDGRVIEHIGPKAVGAFIAGAIDRFEYFEFAVLNAVVSLQSDDVATGRVYIWELRQQSGQWSNAFGLYRDTYRRAGNRWVFAERDYSSLARTAPGGGGMEVFAVPQ